MTSADDSPSRIGRVGFAGRALLYALIAYLAARTAVGFGGDAGAKGAFATLARQPLGGVALAALGCALLAFAGWSGLQAVSGDRELIDRARHAGQAILYIGLGGLAARQVFTSSGSGGGASSLTGSMLQQPVGRVAIGLVGLAVIGAGAVRGWRARNDDLKQALADDHGAPPGWGSTVGRIGYAGRGLSLILLGGFIVHSAVTVDTEVSKGMDVALQEAAQTVVGRPAVALVALGLGCLALWFGLLARFGVADEDTQSPIP